MHLQVGYGGYGVIWLTPNHKKKSLIGTRVFWKTLTHSLFSSSGQGFWAGWEEHRVRRKRKRRTRRRTKSQRTPVPPKSPKVTRRKRRTSRQLQLNPQPPPPRPHHRPRHVRTAEHSATFLLEWLGLEWVLLTLCLSVASSDPYWTSRWTLHGLPLSRYWWVKCMRGRGTGAYRNDLD